MKYRADIDGLRAIAVGAVVAFHAGVPGSSGGYVGVDVFFVISGFLITTILVSELAAEGRLSFARFYERRIRRIFPALFAMIAVTAPVAAVVLLPSDLARFGASVAATTVFASNVLFWSEAGYFQTDSELKPLLHTWSLAVEEQFYFALPVLLWALHRAGLRSRPAIAWAAAASFALSVLFVWRRRELGFFLPFGRAWELLLGSWLAAGPPLPLSDRARGALSWAGLAALALPIVAYDAQTPFPGPAALLPCLGAAALLEAGRAGAPTAAGRALAARPMVVVGLGSYSLYLWHWPVYALLRYRAVFEPGAVAVAAATVAAGALTWASYRFVELPTRHSKRSRRAVFVAGGLGTGWLAALGALAWGAGGWPARAPAEVLAYEAGADDRVRSRACFPRSPAQVARGELCREGSGGPVVLSWGDSHADAWAPALTAAAERASASVVFANTTSCPPLSGVRTAGSDCRAFNDAVAAWLSEHPEVTDVVLSARWAAYVEGTRYGPVDPGPIPGDLALDGLPAGTPREDVVAAGLEATVRSLAGRRVWLLAQAPEVGHDVPSVLARQAWFGDARPFRRTRAEVAARKGRSDALLAKVAAATGATLLDPAAPLCAADPCSVVWEGRSAYVDDDHLSATAARGFAPALAPVFAPR